MEGCVREWGEEEGDVRGNGRGGKARERDGDGEILGGRDMVGAV